MAGDATQHVDVPGDQRALGNDAEREAIAARQSLEDAACDLEAPLGGLIRIGRGPDDDGTLDSWNVGTVMRRSSTRPLFSTVAMMHCEFAHQLYDPTERSHPFVASVTDRPSV